MSRLSAKYVAIAVVVMGLLVSTSAAMAQSREDDARFEAAQERFDHELALYKAEFDRYQQARAGETQARRDDRDDDDRAGADTPRGRDDRAAADASRVPDDRDAPDDRGGRDGPDNGAQGGNEPPPR